MRPSLFVLAAVVACGGKPPAATTAVPAGPVSSSSLRDLTATDPDLSPIAMAAAKALRPNSDGKVRFAGVFVGTRELIALGDSVARSIGAVRVGGLQNKVPFTVARMDGMSSARINEDATVSFAIFRVAIDVAYVGVNALSAARPTGALCITLLRSSSAWTVSDSREVVSPKQCGPK